MSEGPREKGTILVWERTHAISPLLFVLGRALTARRPRPDLLRRSEELVLFHHWARSSPVPIGRWRGARPERPRQLGVARAVTAQPE